MEELSTVRLLTGSVLGCTDWATWRAHGVTTPKRVHYSMPRSKPVSGPTTLVWRRGAEPDVDRWRWQKTISNPQSTVCPRQWQSSEHSTISTEWPSARGDLGATLYRLGEHAAGRRLIEEGLAGLREFGDLWQAAIAQWELGTIAIDEHDPARAWDLLTDGLRFSRDSSDHGRVCWFLQGLAYLAAEQDQPFQALRLASAAQTLGNRVHQDTPGDDSSGPPYGWQRSTVATPAVLGNEATYLRAARSQLSAAPRPTRVSPVTHVPGGCDCLRAQQKALTPAHA